jgi:hypothetical protein
VFTSTPQEREKKKWTNRRMPRPLAHSFTVPPFHIFGDCCILWQDAYLPMVVPKETQFLLTLRT